MIEKMREELATAQIREFFEKMQQMGVSSQKTIVLIEKMMKEGKA